MNISSIKHDEFYPTPEFRNILDVVNNLKRDVTRFNETQNKITYNKIMKNVDALEEALLTHYQDLNAIDQVLTTAASTKLTRKQLTILKWLIHKYDKKTVYTSLIQRLSIELDIPESTIRWNLRGLRDAELINAGTKENKGIPVTLTEKGRIIANYTIDI